MLRGVWMPTSQKVRNLAYGDLTIMLLLIKYVTVPDQQNLFNILGKQNDSKHAL